MLFSTAGEQQAFIHLDGSLTLGDVKSPASITINRETGNSAIYHGVLVNGEVSAGVTESYSSFESSLNTEAQGFTLEDVYHFSAIEQNISSGSVVSTQYGFYVDSSVNGASNNYGFYTAVPGSAGNYGFYSEGSAPSYFGGQITSPGIYSNVAAAAANVYIDIQGNLYRSSSSAKYKKNIESVSEVEAKKVLDLRPVTFHGKDQEDSETGHFGSSQKRSQLSIVAWLSLEMTEHPKVFSMTVSSLLC